MQISPVLILTRNPALWQQWRKIDGAQWMVARSHSLQDLERRRAQGQPMVILDAALPDLPAWSEPFWDAHLSSLKILVLSPHPNLELARHMLRRGVRGYAHAYLPTPSLCSILQGIKDGQYWLGRSLQQSLIREVSQRLPAVSTSTEHLTPHEQAIASRIAQGQGIAQIAQGLGCEAAVIRQHLHEMFDKLQVSDCLSMVLQLKGVQFPA
ncbi:MAG: response regulator transcription factor [Comamonas sp.]|nr:response regulator transcription factor [Comamonas sp.]